jgi:hypothetical protein
VDSLFGVNVKALALVLVLLAACKHLEKDDPGNAPPPENQDPRASAPSNPSGSQDQGSTAPSVDDGSTSPPGADDPAPSLVTYACRFKNPSLETDWCLEITIDSRYASRSAIDLCSPSFGKKQFSDYKWSDQTCQSVETAGGGCQFSSSIKGWTLQSLPAGIKQAQCERIAFIIAARGYQANEVQLIDAKP